MDQAFIAAPVTTGSDEDNMFYKNLRNAMEERRPTNATVPTTKIFQEGGTLEDCLKSMSTSPSLDRPVNELVLVSHASETGWMEMALTDDLRQTTQYEDLDAAKTAINIPETILQKDGATQKAKVRVKGCRIGLSLPFVDHLKIALGPVDTITTSKHFHGGADWKKNDETEGYIEYLVYCFESYSLSPITKLGDAIALLKGDGHKYFDASSVPDTKWKEWANKAKVPNKIDPGTHNRGRYYVKLPAAWGASFPNGAIESGLIFDYVIPGDNGPWKVGRAPAGTNTQEAIKAFLKSRFTAPVTDPKQIATWAKFSGAHPWPIWKRFLKVRYDPFDSLDDFLGGFVWKYDDAVGGWLGQRHRVRFLVPITDPATQNTLLGNWFPLSATAAHADLIETDGPLFSVR
jgi:hypothetical protein